MEVDAIIHTVKETEYRGAKGFAVRELIAILGSGDKYPQTVKFEVMGDKTTLLDDYHEGQKVRIHFDIRGREWQDKVFNSLVIWKITTDEENTPQRPPQPAPRAQAAPPPKKVLQATLDGGTEPAAGYVDSYSDDGEEVPF
jgi:single-strand DNA-binding protein